MYKIKQIPEDFIVDEIFEPKFDAQGKYGYYLLKKRNYNTIDAINTIAKRVGIKQKYINFAGTKDKAAVTTQYISISNGPKKDLQLKDIELTFLGRGNERINLGLHSGNHFKITVRNIDKKPEKIEKILNLFDSQRFGENNAEVGKLIIKRDLKKACVLINDEKVNVHLSKHHNDYVGALKTLPKRLLKLYIHAYQSCIWNEMALHAREKKLPLIGFDTNLSKDLKKALEKEGVDQEDFLIREIPEISAEGAIRDVHIDVKEMVISELEDDELNPGMKRVLVEFSLPKGAYATQVIAQHF